MSGSLSLPALVRVAVVLVVSGATPLLAACGDDDQGDDRSGASVVGGDESGEDRNPDDDETDWSEFAVEPLSAPAREDVALPEPAERVTCRAPTISVGDSASLEAALADAQPGDVIGLAAGTYDGNFVATAEATAEAPIHLCGPTDAVLAGEGPEESGYVLHLDGADHWRLVGFTVRDGRKGVMVDAGAGNVIQALNVTHIGDEAIHLRSHSTDNLVLDNEVSDTGIRRDKFGEGVYIGSAESNWCEYTGCEPDRSDDNRIEGNHISGVTSEAIDIKEGTVDGVVLDNVIDGAAIAAADSWIDVKGNSWVVAGNRLEHGPEHGIQTHEIIQGWGSGNAFIDNVLNLDADGFGFDMHGPEATNLVACDNEVVGAGDGFANEDCR